MFASLPIAWLALVGCVDLQERGALDLAEGDPPTIEILSPASGDLFARGEPVPFEAVADDPDGLRDVRFVTWSSDLDGDLAPRERPDDQGVSRLELPLSPGEHVVTAAAEDRAGFIRRVTVDVVVDDIEPAPVVTLTSPQAGAGAYEGQSLRLDATVVDARFEPQALTARWLARFPGGPTETIYVGPVGPTGHVDVSWLVEQQGALELTVEVDNPRGWTGSDGLTVQVGEPWADDRDGDGVSPLDGDCDDTDPGIFPGAEETVDGLDEDCNGRADDGTVRYDDDGDGFCEDPAICTGPAALPGDCDDADPDVHPDAAEVCFSGIDENCDGQQDTEDADGCRFYREDLDGDGFGVTNQPSRCLCEPEGTWSALAAGDCDDTFAGYHPGAPDLMNGEDEDCDGVPDDEPHRNDLDGDGFCADPIECELPVWSPGDCDDTDRLVHPNAFEDCWTPHDDNCNTVTNEENSRHCTGFYADLDGDGWGVQGSYACLCEPNGIYGAPPGQYGDCDDLDPRAFPGQTQFFSTASTSGGFDFNCNGLTERTRPRTSYSCEWDLGGGWCNVILDGWYQGVPDCGGTGTWGEGCDGAIIGSCSPSTTSVESVGCR